MPCYHPIPAWYAKKRNESGKRGIVFNPADGFKDRKLEVPCGRCIGCQLERSRQWAVRCMHESKEYDANCFVTLTYDPAHVPVLPGSNVQTLRPRDYQLFMKRLRLVKPGVRFFQCGEYGEQFSRPHHHAILFNCHFADSRFLKTKAGIELYTSEELDELWGLGQCTVGAVTFESAAYVARYCMKKLEGKDYGDRVAEFATMSRRPGIGAAFLERFRSDIYPSDECVVRGVACRPPRYYDSRLEKVAPSVLSRVKARRRRMAAEELDRLGEESEYRDAVAGELENGKKLKVREVVKQAAINNLVREVEK